MPYSLSKTTVAALKANMDYWFENHKRFTNGLCEISAEQLQDLETIRYRYANHDAVVVKSTTGEVINYLGSSASLLYDETIVVINPRGKTFYGFNGDDIMWGSEGSETLNGGAGNDRLYGLGGIDKLIGSDGTDLLCGGGGNDVLEGHMGDDILYGEWNYDKLFGNEGDDWLCGGQGINELHGGPGNDLYLYDGQGIQNIYDCEGNNFLAIHSDFGKGEKGWNVKQYLKIRAADKHIKLRLHDTRQQSYTPDTLDYPIIIHDAFVNENCMLTGVYNGREFYCFEKGGRDGWYLSDCIVHTEF